MKALRIGLLVGICTATVVVVVAVVAIAAGVGPAGRSGTMAGRLWHLTHVELADGRAEVPGVDAVIAFTSDGLIWTDGITWCEGSLSGDSSAFKVGVKRCTKEVYAGSPSQPQGRAVQAMGMLRRGDEITVTVVKNTLVLSAGAAKLTLS